MDTGERLALETELALLFADTSPRRGIEWINSLDPSSGRVAGIAAVFGEALGKNKHSNWKKDSLLICGSARSAFIMGIFSGYGSTDASAAWKSFEAEAKLDKDLEQIKGQLLKRLSATASDDFWQVVTERVNHMKSDEEANAEIKTFFEYARFSYPTNALNALVSLTDEEVRSRAARSYVSGLTENELSDFIRVISSSTVAQKEKDRLLADSIDYLFYKNPGEAARATNRINSSQLKKTLMEKIIRFSQSKGPDVEKAVRSQFQ